MLGSRIPAMKARHNTLWSQYIEWVGIDWGNVYRPMYERYPYPVMDDQLKLRIREEFNREIRDD